MFWGCSGMDVISSRWESIIPLFKDDIPIGYKDI